MSHSKERKLALVVDDSAVVRKVVGRILRHIGFRVSCQVDGQAALEYCRTEMPDFILLDWHMPRMDGMAFLNQLKAEYSGQLPRIAFCTTENQPREIAEALSAGADEYIMKPFDEQIIRMKLEQIGFSLQPES